jgi:cell division protein FtsQ
MKDAPMVDSRIQPQRSATPRTDDSSGSLMVRDSEAVILSIVDDQLIISVPNEDRSGQDSRGLLPEGYIAVTSRHREHAESSASASASASASTAASPAIPQRRTIARGQARSAANWRHSSTSSVQEKSLAQRSPDEPRKMLPSESAAQGKRSPKVAPVIVDQRLLGRPAAVRAAQRQRNRQRIGRSLFGSIAAAAAAFGIYESSLVRVTNIVVTGNRDISSATIRQAMFGQPQTSMLTLRVEELRTNLLALPLVAEAQVWKSWPNTIQVRIRERFGVATIAAPSGWVVLDQDGVVLDRRVTRPNFPSLSVNGVELTEPALSDESMAQLIGPALASLAVAPSKLVVLVDRVMMIDGGLTLVMNRSNQSADGDAQQDDRPVDGPADQLFVTFGSSNDLRAKWEAIDIMRTRVDLSGYAVLDVSVANQPALLPKVTQQSETSSAESPQESVDSDELGNESARVTETSPATI